MVGGKMVLKRLYGEQIIAKGQHIASRNYRSFSFFNIFNILQND